MTQPHQPTPTDLLVSPRYEHVLTERLGDELAAALQDGRPLYVEGLGHVFENHQLLHPDHILDFLAHFKQTTVHALVDQLHREAQQEEAS